MRRFALLLAPLCIAPLGCEDAADLPEEEAVVDSGTLVLRRLNRSEYDRTVRDLLGTTQQPALEFPEDDLGYGYDTIASVLSMSPLHVELYERAADLLLDEVLAIPQPMDVLVEAEGESVVTTAGGATAGFWNLWANGEAYTLQDVPRAGTYRLSARLGASQGGPDLAHAEFRVDDVDVVDFDVAATRESPIEYSQDFDIEPGTRKFAVAFTNDFYDPDLGVDRNLYVDWIRIQGPLGVGTENPLRSAIVPCAPASEDDEAACLREVLEDFLPRAFRRPVTQSELEAYGGFLDGARELGDGFEQGLRQALKAALVSPNFLFRVERDPSPDSTEVHRLTDHEVATRLSYFLWSSMPDAELFAAARDGALQDPAVLAAQARRMLADDRAEALVDDFAGQWLYIRALDDVSPDAWYFPDFDEALREAMREEMKLFFRTFLHEDRPLSELLTSEETFINERLAAHYGHPHEGEAFAPVQVEGRSGLLGMAGLLTATSFPTRTSPVKRGQWVLAQLLCSEPEPPPAGVEGLPESVDQDLPLRERLEQHRADPECAGCHSVMDQIGFGLEHFDGIGKWRDDEDGLSIDDSGVLPGDVTFDGAVELGEVLAQNPWMDICLTRQLMTYGLGRGVFVEDRAQVEGVSSTFAEAGGTLEELVVAIVQSEMFRSRRGGTNSGRKM